MGLVENLLAVRNLWRERPKVNVRVWHPPDRDYIIIRVVNPRPRPVRINVIGFHFAPGGDLRIIPLDVPEGMVPPVSDKLPKRIEQAEEVISTGDLPQTGKEASWYGWKGTNIKRLYVLDVEDNRWEADLPDSVRAAVQWHVEHPDYEPDEVEEWTGGENSEDVG